MPFTKDLDDENGLQVKFTRGYIKDNVVQPSPTQAPAPNESSPIQTRLVAYVYKSTPLVKDTPAPATDLSTE